MEEHHIHGQNVMSHGETFEALHYLKSDSGKHIFEHNLEEARQHGKAVFTVNGKDFMMRKEANEEGKPFISIQKSIPQSH